MNEALLSAREPAARGRQGASATPSAFAGSRSQSIASFTSDTPTDKRRKGRPSQKIKAEPPTTPAPLFSDTEQPQQSSGRRGRPRNGTVTKTDVNRATTTAKRKRSPGRDSASPSLPPPARAQLSLHTSHDASLVTVSKNFAKTSQLLLNDIVSHKLAGIFAKPLSERDAPGYKDLILRPQDLKSIKAAITKGGKAALAAIEMLDEEAPRGEQTPMRSAPGAYADRQERALGNGVYLVKANEDLMPPRGIVNSTQLEMELVRTFANAVMFNPLPSSERGFGRSLRLRENGGDVKPKSERDGEDEEESNETASSDEGTPSDEGGIIADAREMFEDVQAQVQKWREVEVERLGGTDDSGKVGAHPMPSAQGPHGTASANASVRHSSVSSAVNDEDAGAGESTPIPTGTGRKRRRIAEN